MSLADVSCVSEARRRNVESASQSVLPPYFISIDFYCFVSNQRYSSLQEPLEIEEKTPGRPLQDTWSNRGCHVGRLLQHQL